MLGYPGPHSGCPTLRGPSTSGAAPGPPQWPQCRWVCCVPEAREHVPTPWLPPCPAQTSARGGRHVAIRHPPSTDSQATMASAATTRCMWDRPEGVGPKRPTSFSRSHLNMGTAIQFHPTALEWSGLSCRGGGTPAPQTISSLYSCVAFSSFRWDGCDSLRMERTR